MPSDDKFIKFDTFIRRAYVERINRVSDTKDCFRFEIIDDALEEFFD